MKGNREIFKAIESGNVERLRELVRKGVDVNLPDEEGYTPLFRAAFDGNPEAVKVLIEAGAEVHTVSPVGDTPLEAIIPLLYFPDYPKVLRLLIDEYIRRDMLDVMFNEGKTLLYFAIVGGSLRQVKRLIENGITRVYVNAPPDLALHVAIEFEHLSIAKYLIRKVGIDPNVKDPEFGDTLLHHAADTGNLRVVKFVVEELGVGLNARNNEGFTPLHTAAFAGHLNVVKYLIDAGANVNARDKNGNTPLHLAAMWGNGAVVSYLVRNGANVTLRNREGKTPCDMALSLDVQVLMGLCNMFTSNVYYLES